MEDLFSPVSTTYLKPPPASTSSPRRDGDAPPAPHLTSDTISTPHEALAVLRSQPDYDTLLAALRFLSRDTDTSSTARPSPDGAQIAQVLASDIAPNYWPTLCDDHGSHDGRDLLLGCLRTVAGINAQVLQLRALAREGPGPARPHAGSGIGIRLDILAAVLEPEDLVFRLGTAGAGPEIEPAPQRKQFFNEVVSLLAGGRVLSAAAEAESLAGREAGNRWVASGSKYTAWLGRAIACWARRTADGGGGGHEDENENELRLCGVVWARALRLGYPDLLIGSVADALLLDASAPGPLFSTLLGTLPAPDQKKILISLVAHLSTRFLSSLTPTDLTPSPAVSTVAGLLNRAAAGDQTRIAALAGWLTGATGAGLGEGPAVRRAVAAVATQGREDALQVAEAALALWGDELYIRHSPTLQQEAHAQVLLLAVGRLHRLAPLKLVSLVRTGGYLAAISNRIGSSRSRSRFLGMVVGEALSALVDPPDRRLSFGFDELDTDEAAWWRGLVAVQDPVGDCSAAGAMLLLGGGDEQQRQQQQKEESIPQPPSPQPQPHLQASKKKKKDEKPAPKRLIQVIDDDSSPAGEEKQSEEGDDDADHDLAPYPAPAHDPYDSDEDPTLLRRDPDKPRPPVYIRTLLSYLGASEDPARLELALTHGPDLIRHKAGHGTEVVDHAIDLASRLASLSDAFDTTGFDDLRARGLVALVVACPDLVAPYLGRVFWDADMSTAQRVAVLVAIGVGGRQLAGAGEEERGGTGTGPMVGSRLPERLEKLYLSGDGPASSSPGSRLQPLPRNALDTAARDLTAAFLAPIAASAADSKAGPDALKLTSFKSRLSSATASASSSGVTKTRRPPAAVPNTTATTLYRSFFSPLVARLGHALGDPGLSRRVLAHNPHLLATYIRTLGVIFHAAGPGTLAVLPRMTSELWGLLLHLGTRRAGGGGAGGGGGGGGGSGGGDMVVVHAVLGALIALFEVHDATGPRGLRRLCEEFGREVVETREWVAAVFISLRGEGGGGAGGGGHDDSDEGAVKMLAAGMLVRLDEAMEKYRRLLVGDMVDG